MPVKDQVSQLTPELAMYAAISSATTTTGGIIDTQMYNMGLSFFLALPVYTDGTYTLAIYEGDESDLSDAAAVDSSQIIGSLPALSALTDEGDEPGKVGVFGTKRYVRADVVSASVTTGATAMVMAVKGADVVAES